MITLTLTVPSPPVLPRIDRFLAAQLHGLSRRQCKGLIDAGQVRIDGRVVRRAGAAIQAGQRVEVSYRPSLLPPAAGMGPETVLLASESWIAVDKPCGVPSHRPAEGAKGVPELLLEGGAGDWDDLAPVHRLDRQTSGVLLLARGRETRALLSDLFATRAIEKAYRVVVLASPEQESGDLAEPEGMHLTWRVLRRSSDGTRSELLVRPREGRTHQVRIQLAAAGMPIVGDLEHGRAVAGGSPRMALHCERLAWGDHVVTAAPPGRWDELLDPVSVSPVKGSAAGSSGQPERRKRATGLASLKVSSATARVLRRGHPWVLRDSHTGSLGVFQTGESVHLLDPRGRYVATAVVDPKAILCARVVGSDPADVLDEQFWAGRVGRAIERRKKIAAGGENTAIRWIHGEADGLPGLHLDQWGDLLVATRKTEAVAPFSQVAYALLREHLGPLALYEQDHFEDLRSRREGAIDAQLEGRWIEGHSNEERRVVVERGLRFAVSPVGTLSAGLYPDQRANRRRMTDLLASQDNEGLPVANLFGHTGAFSVAAAAAGARRVITVDLSPRYLDWTAQNLSLNGFEVSDHPTVAIDSLKWLHSSDELLGGVVLDPPAYARSRDSGGRDWNARRDYRAIVEASARRLAPGAWMLCCINLKGAGRRWLADVVRTSLAEAGRQIDGKLVAAGPSEDHPTRRGFPEGVPFEGVLVRMD